MIIQKIKRLIKHIYLAYYKHLHNSEVYARKIGVSIGKNCQISTTGFSTEPYLITIGNNVQITMGVQLHTHGGCHVARLKIPQFDTFGKIVIKDNAYIGTYSQIMPGVTIGEGSLVAAGSIVTKSVPAGVVVGGNPAKIISDVDSFISHNEKYNVNSKSLSPAQKKDLLLSLSEDMFISKPYMKIKQL